jgi:fatty-acyl-CoA synthase
MIPTANLAALLRQTARRFPDRLALAWGEQSWSWSELDARVRGAAAGLLPLGVAPGERVLVHARNSNAMFETMWACWMIGAVWVPTNFRLSPPEVAYLAGSSRAALHLFDDAFPDHAAAAREANPAARATLDLGADWEALAATRPLAEHPADVAHDHPCWFFYTSGTTGRPKAAVLTHGQMNFVVTNHLADLMPGTTERDVSLVVAPLSHGAGIHQLTQVARGAATVLLPGERLDCAEAWRLVERHRVSNMFTVPTILTALTRDAAVDRHDHSSLRHVIYAGAPMYREDQRHALRKLGPVLVQYFGLGEVTGTSPCSRPRCIRWTTTRCPSAPAASRAREWRSRSSTRRGRGSPRARRARSACAARPSSPAISRMTAANAKAFAGGWFRTGDLGHLDARGFLYITGRQSDMYISGGSNVYPREVEEALLTHPAVAEACVVGLPHARWGECGVAVLVPRPGARSSRRRCWPCSTGGWPATSGPSAWWSGTPCPARATARCVKNEVRRLLAEDAPGA